MSMFCRSMMAVYIPRVLRLSDVKLWCVKMGIVGDNIGRGVMWGISWVSYLEAWMWVAARATWGVGMEGFGSFSSIWGWGTEVPVERSRPCVVGKGFHALHWKMLSWLEFGRCMWVLRILRRGWVVRDICGGCVMGFLRVEVVWCVGGGSMYAVVALYGLTLLGGF